MSMNTSASTSTGASKGVWRFSGDSLSRRLEGYSSLNSAMRDICKTVILQFLRNVVQLIEVSTEGSYYYKLRGNDAFVRAGIERLFTEGLYFYLQASPREKRYKQLKSDTDLHLAFAGLPKYFKSNSWIRMHRSEVASVLDIVFAGTVLEEQRVREKEGIVAVTAEHTCTLAQNVEEV